MARFHPGIRRTQVFSPGTVQEAVQVLTEVADQATVLAGGTDLMVMLEAGTWRPEGVILDIGGLSELRYVRLEDGLVRIGALTTYTDLMRSEVIAAEAPCLVAAAGSVGAVQIQNRGTVGGNIMNASPAGDLMPPLLAVGASVTLRSNEGARNVPLYSFYAGYRRPVAKRSELLTEVAFPRAPVGAVDYFRKVGTRSAQAIAKVVLAGRAWDVAGREKGRPTAQFRLGIGSVAPTPTRLFETERVLASQVLDDQGIRRALGVLVSEIAPIDDVRSTAAYRRMVAANLLGDLIARLVEPPSDAASAGPHKNS